MWDVTWVLRGRVWIPARRTLAKMDTVASPLLTDSCAFFYKMEWCIQTEDHTAIDCFLDKKTDMDTNLVGAAALFPRAGAELCWRTDLELSETKCKQVFILASCNKNCGEFFPHWLECWADREKDPAASTPALKSQIQSSKWIERHLMSFTYYCWDVKLQASQSSGAYKKLLVPERG